MLTILLKILEYVLASFQPSYWWQGRYKPLWHAYVPLDEALSRVVIDFQDDGVEYKAEYPRQYINDFDVDLIHEFFQGFCNHAMVTLHIDNIKGENGHHIAETILKLLEGI